MQSFIVALLIFGSCAYLVFKWLPKNHKQKLTARLVKIAPKLSEALPIPNDGCSGGCSSCGACEQPSIKNNANDGIKIIRIVPNFSRLN